MPTPAAHIPPADGQYELERVRAGYWRHLAAPDSAYALLTEDYHYAPGRLRRYAGRACSVAQVHRHLVKYAVEVEHRRHPITRLHQLKQVQLRIAAPGYDFNEAIALRVAVDAAEGLLRATRMAEQAAAVRAAHAKSSCARVTRELTQKQLPSGAVGNLAILRQLVRAPIPA